MASVEQSRVNQAAVAFGILLVTGATAAAGGIQQSIAFALFGAVMWLVGSVIMFAWARNRGAEDSSSSVTTSRGARFVVAIAFAALPIAFTVLALLTQLDNVLAIVGLLLFGFGVLVFLGTIVFAVAIRRRD